MADHSSLVGVGEAAAFVSAASGVLAYWVRARGRERLAAIQGASGADKAKLVADAIAMFDIPVEGLSPEARERLVLEQLRDRDRQRGRVFALSIVLMVLLASTTVALAAMERASGKPQDTSGPANSGPTGHEDRGAAQEKEVKQTTGTGGVNFSGAGNTGITITTNPGPGSMLPSRDR